MKATIALLTALVVSAITFNTARAQEPIQPAGLGGKLHGGGCADGSCVDGSADGSVGKGHWFGKSCHGCGKLGGGCGKLGGWCGMFGSGCGNGCGHKCLSWLCRPLPSDAPSCNKHDYPLGFPASPYVRSPRDYFLDP